MLTKTDLQKIKKLFENFATKDDFDQHRKEVHGDIVQFKDDILKEIVDLRDNITVITEYRDMIEDHKNRIHKIEHKVFTAS